MASKSACTAHSSALRLSAKACSGRPGCRPSTASPYTMACGIYRAARGNVPGQPIPGPPGASDLLTSSWTQAERCSATEPQYTANKSWRPCAANRQAQKAGRSLKSAPEMPIRSVSSQSLQRPGKYTLASRPETDRRHGRHRPPRQWIADRAQRSGRDRRGLKHVCGIGWIGYKGRKLPPQGHC